GLGGVPDAGLVADAAGNLYGTTETAGRYGLGTIFRIKAGTKTLQTWWNFTGGTDGKSPTTKLTIDRFGNIFGTTNGGLITFGTVFEITTSGTFLTLARFDPTTGTHPSDVVVDAQGNLYGTTQSSG